MKQSGAAAAAAQAKAEEEIASRDRAKQSFERYQAATMAPRQAGRPIPSSGSCRLRTSEEIYLAAEEWVANAQATAAQARLAYQSDIDGVDTDGSARLQAEAGAGSGYDLDQTVFRAPTGEETAT